ncbi:hypothetical protein ACIOJE_19825 [Kitasatospora sp. NPDC087861]|uniref:hypothetical protein n=1 Tax=Kitasatospora sp. NPDC087861 TaxID=3364070 RepID=UPI00380BF5EA
MTTSTLAFDVIDIDVDIDLALDADPAADLPVLPVAADAVGRSGAAPQVVQLDFEVGAPALMDPPPQSTQMDFDTDIA